MSLITVCKFFRRNFFYYLSAIDWVGIVIDEFTHYILRLANPNQANIESVDY